MLQIPQVTDHRSTYRIDQASRPTMPDPCPVGVVDKSARIAISSSHRQQWRRRQVSPLRRHQIFDDRRASSGCTTERSRATFRNTPSSEPQEGFYSFTIQKRPEPTRRRHRRGPRAQLRSSDHHSMPSSMALASALPPSSPARELLRRAQQTAEVDTDWLGRRPCVMDVILNAMPPVSEYSEDIVMEALERSQAVFPRDDYVFDDQESLERYWADHAALWRGVAVQPAHYPSSKRYQVSAERSTASWTTDTEGNSSQLDDGRYCISAGATLPPSNI